MKNISLLVCSCDLYNPVVENFNILLDRYWKIDCPKIFCGETIGGGEEYENALPGAGAWGMRMLAALEKINTEYLIVFCEDYWLSKKIDEKFIQSHIDTLESHNAVKIVTDIVYPYPEYTLNPISNNLWEFDKTSKYQTTIQPGIVRTDYFKQLLRPEYTAWDLELLGNETWKELGGKVLLSEQERIYFNAFRAGFVKSEGFDEFITKEKLTWN